MKTYDTVQIDNRDAGQMYEYLEARIDVMKRRISELEKENQVLRTDARESHRLTKDMRLLLSNLLAQAGASPRQDEDHPVEGNPFPRVADSYRTSVADR